jgi:hypothetical protein
MSSRVPWSGISIPITAPGVLSIRLTMLEMELSLGTTSSRGPHPRCPRPRHLPRRLPRDDAATGSVALVAREVIVDRARPTVKAVVRACGVQAEGALAQILKRQSFEDGSGQDCVYMYVF